MAATTHVALGPTFKRALGEQEYDSFIRDTLLKVTPGAKYALATGALLSIICSIACAIFALYAQSALFFSIFIPTAYGAHYYPRRSLNAILWNLSERVMQLHTETQIKAQQSQTLHQGDEKRLRSEDVFHSERRGKESDSLKKIREEELKFLEQLKKALGVSLPATLVSQSEEERIASLRRTLLAQATAMKKEHATQQRVIEVIEPDDFKRKIIMLRHTVQEVLERHPPHTSPS